MNQQLNRPQVVVPNQASKRWRWLFAELFIIVLGVLIALAIDEWRENAANATLERQYLHQLIADLRLTEDLMAEVVEENELSKAATRSLVQEFESAETPTVEQVRTLLLSMFAFNNPVPVLGTSEALVTTGDLRLINNETARSDITGYLSRSRDFFLTPIYQVEATHQDLVIQLYMLANSYGISSEKRMGSAHNKITSDVAAFLADPEAYVVTASLASNSYLMSMYRDELAADSKKLRESLESLVTTL